MNWIDPRCGSLHESLRWSKITDMVTPGLGASRDAAKSSGSQSDIGFHDVRIFGSVARGDSTESSDLDLLVRFEQGRSLFDHGGLLVDLEELLGVKVDVVSEGGMRERFRDGVLREVVAL